MQNRLPYFDYLLAAFAKGQSFLEDSFGHHVHWGYWAFPEQAKPDHADFAAAAENLSLYIITAARVTNQQAVLDVGCGFGGTIASLNSHFEGMALTGLNIDERHLERARLRVTPLDYNSIVFQQGDACALPFADNSFDAVLAVECIFHFPSREKFFAEAYRVLKPGGYLALSDFLLTKKLSRFDKFKFSQYLSNGFFGGCDVQFTPADYTALAAKSGFSVELADNINENTLPTYRYLRSLVKESGFLKLSSLSDLNIALTVLSVEFFSKIQALKYFVFAFKKPE